MEYTVDLSAQVGDQAADSDLSVRLLIALEEIVLAPATSQNIVRGFVSATFCVSAADAYDATVIAAEFFRLAIRAAGVTGDIHLTEIQVAEEHEEAATAV